MILVFGGTTEGRIAVKTLDEGEGRYFYSTLEDLQAIECVHGQHIVGKMDTDSIKHFCKKNEIMLIIDSAHPFAENLHATVSKVSIQTGIPVIRLERQFPEYREDRVVIWCSDYQDAVNKMLSDDINKLLALSGVNTISKIRDFWKQRETYYRILDREESFEKVKLQGFLKENLVFYEKGKLQKLIDNISPDAILTKESGISGGFEEKVQVASKNNIRLYVVKRPKLPDNFITVDGPHGLRRAVEKILPEFYPLHSGFTTGSCATAAAKGALFGLLKGIELNEVSFHIPEGETMKMEIDSVSISENSATATVIKDAGDDPDITDGSKIRVTVSYSDHIGIRFIGGEGIGTVTLPGLGLEVGEPAINPVPRRMISSELRKMYEGGLDVTISIENGKALAEKTFNPRVGVVGGISIIGTTGIVRPFSHEAFVDSIRRQMNVALSMKCDRVVINSGGKSEGFMKKIYRDLSPQSFIHYGNAIGETLSIASVMGVKKLSIGIMLGKAVKLAEGHLDTHSHKITFNKDFLKKIARDSGCSQASIDNIDSLNLARELPSILLSEDQDKFFRMLVNLCHNNCKKLFSNSLNTYILADDGRILAEIES